MKYRNMIYFDNNATTPLAPEVAQVIAGLQEQFGNPSSVHAAGREARRLIDEARQKIAGILRAPENRIFFSSGGTESLNAALLGIFSLGSEKRHLIVSSVEHHAVLNTAAYLEKSGCSVTRLKVDGQGRLEADALETAIRQDTALIAVMFANNETGNLYPVKKIGEIARDRGIPFLCDGVQALGKLEIDLSLLPIDILVGAAHKFHGPKGAGFLYLRDGMKLDPVLHGGRQERGIRPGTENTPAIVGMAEALSLSLKNPMRVGRQIRDLRDRLQAGILDRLPGTEILGDPEHRMDNTLNFRIDGISGESLLINLDMAGVAAGLGAACESGSLEPSHVLMAMGLSPEQALGGLRFSLSRYNTEAEVDSVLDLLPGLVERIRAAA